ncbi:MAG: DinB family protein [Flavisolibacter sp.]
MINKKQVVADLDRSTNDLVAQLEKCNDQDFNTPPADNCWSSAQIVEHILLLETSVNQALQKAEITERHFDLKVLPVKHALENLQKKWQAPEFIHPTSIPKQKNELIKSIIVQRDILKELIANSDLSHTPLYKHPVIGDMTRLEWIYFNIHHSDRHMRQIENMQKKEG